MKNIIGKYVLAAALTLSLCGCSDTEDPPEEGSAAQQRSGAAAVTAAASEEEAAEPFSEYNFEFGGISENYMVIIRRGEYDDEISVTIENSRYESRDFVITAPAGYTVLMPYEQRYASSAVKVIKNDIDDSFVPDIMQFDFYISGEGLQNAPENPVYTVSRMYTVNASGELREIKAVALDENAETGLKVYDYIDRTQLYHSEPNKFIYEITVDESNIYDELGNVRPIEDRVRIKTLTFDFEREGEPLLIEGYEDISVDNPLYFGYAYWAAANSAAQYFIMTTFNISDFENSIETTDASGTSFYYFKIDDPRFSSTADLHAYLETIFSKSTADRIFSEAPQKYTDIDGELYGIAGDGGHDFTLGTLTFSDMEITENRMLFRSRQEKFDDNGAFVGYTDGGNFAISLGEDGIWRVIQYRYPYS